MIMTMTMTMTLTRAILVPSTPPRALPPDDYDAEDYELLTSPSSVRHSPEHATQSHPELPDLVFHPERTDRGVDAHEDALAGDVELLAWDVLEALRRRAGRERPVHRPQPAGHIRKSGLHLLELLPEHS